VQRQQYALSISSDIAGVFPRYKITSLCQALETSRVLHVETSGFTSAVTASRTMPSRQRRKRTAGQRPRIVQSAMYELFPEDSVSESDMVVASVTEQRACSVAKPSLRCAYSMMTVSRSWMPENSRSRKAAKGSPDVYEAMQLLQLDFARPSVYSHC